MFLVQGDTSENEVDGVTDEDPNGLEGMQIVSESKKDPLQGDMNCWSRVSWPR